ncbi:redox-regulated ATPase YchF [Candidatus Magnetominusculus xianensis]|uniref:GTP-binding protein n=1 Tax=Candidatus Magnetominusculus xianensis TaxID=1748249 RepID=A0ABR5SNU0_9BACT|nr:redox-regulated ATPase YchF [Candidatus Magnetominusculus xianensis]KWT94498.1 GTP-binding protein [Candidatus Magnetominusculus xianensis]MBF0405108.1 redox-regulated ATPase YchF [Nitrospirota bacterium]
MKIAITGLPNSGKTTVFNALTGLNAQTSIYPSSMEEPHVGSVRVNDKRVEILSGIYKPKKTTYSSIIYTDFQGLTKGDTTHNRKVFEFIRDADAIVEVVRAFEDDSAIHPDITVDAARDASNLESELLLYDLDLVEKRLGRMTEAAKRGKRPDETEKKILEKCKDILYKEIPLRNAQFTAEEQKAIVHLQFISIKPKIIVVNVSEEAIGKTQPLVEEVAARVNFDKNAVIALSGKIEMEIAQLPPDEAESFLKDMGIDEPALDKVINKGYELLGLIAFLTVGEDEVRAWTITKGISALEAAGKIHSDIERGFIRAEVVAYGDFISSGSMAGVKKLGLARLEGKSYVVEDGDIINFRFNV